jgi:hypothetical protein
MQNSPLEGRLGWAVFEYDFDKHGGAQGAINVGPKLLPPGAIIMDGIIHVKTACLGSSGTLQVKAVGTDDILTATNVSSLTLNALIDIVPVGTATTMIRCTAHTLLVCTIATTDFTAGKVAIGLRWGMTD